MFLLTEDQAEMLAHFVTHYNNWARAIGSQDCYKCQKILEIIDEEGKITGALAGGLIITIKHKDLAKINRE